MKVMVVCWMWTSMCARSEGESGGRVLDVEVEVWSEWRWREGHHSTTHNNGATNARYNKLFENVLNLWS